MCVCVCVCVCVREREREREREYVCVYKVMRERKGGRRKGKGVQRLKFDGQVRWPARL